jgi:hypothetical protein
MQERYGVFYLATLLVTANHRQVSSSAAGRSLLRSVQDTKPVCGLQVSVRNQKIDVVMSTDVGDVVMW